MKFRSIAMLYNNAVISFYEMLSVIPFTFHQSIGWGEAVLFEWHLKRILNLHTVMQTYHIFIRWTFQIFLKLYTLYMYFNKTLRSPGKISPDGQWRLNDPLIKILHSSLLGKINKVKITMEKVQGHTHRLKYMTGFFLLKLKRSFKVWVVLWYMTKFEFILHFKFSWNYIHYACTSIRLEIVLAKFRRMGIFEGWMILWFRYCIQVC